MCSCRPARASVCVCVFTPMEGEVRVAPVWVQPLTALHPRRPHNTLWRRPEPQRPLPNLRGWVPFLPPCRLG